MNLLPKTKIVCTIGPSSWEPDILKKLIDNGMTVARINGAFADIDEMRRVANVVRSVSQDVALMIDVKGHEVRLNKFKFDVDVKIGDQVILGSDSSDYIFIETYPELYKNLQPNTLLLLNDGNTELKVEKIEDKKIYTTVVRGSKILKGKSVNIPGVYLDNPPLTERDIEQVKFAVEDKWDFVALSFVRSKEDVLAARDLILGSHTKVIAKIEDGFGIKNIDEIIQVSEGIMVARGDMGVEIPYYSVPHAQKQIIKKCNEAVKPVIVATQMLESMILNPKPTRAEVSDVANAIIDGTDAVMLSQETTTGQYPLECVQVMKNVSLETEKYIYEKSLLSTADVNVLCDIRDEGTEVAKAMAESVANLSYNMPNAKIIIDTRTGFTAKLVANYNLKNTIIAISQYDYYMRRLSMYRGIKGVTTKSNLGVANSCDLQNSILAELQEKGYLEKGDQVILLLSASFGLIQNGLHEKASIRLITI